MRFIIDGEKPANGLDKSSSNKTYDPDVANAAAFTNDDVTAPSDINVRKMMTKIDLRILPVLSVLYLMAFLDRTNIANAAVFELREDLAMTSIQYSTALVVFFPPYILFEIPSNILLKKLKPNVWLSLCMFGFGLVTICQGLVTSYGGLLATRFFLGLTEAGMFPGCFYLISMWYRREEAQKRYTFFFASTTLAGAFGGLLASAIGKMQGMRGYNGWRWIFILEGVLTCLISFAWWFAIPNFPEDAKWLSEKEAAFVKARLAADQGKSALERRITGRDVLNVFKDYKIFLGGLMYFGLIVPAYGYAYFAPSIIRGYGYTPIQTQLHSVPPWAVAFAFSMCVAALSDKMRHRFLCTIFPILVAISGFAVLLNVHHNTSVMYGMLFLVTSGTYSAMPIIVCWFTMNLGGHHRRAVGSGWIIGFGNIGGIISTYSFQASDAVNFYRTGYSICEGFICLSALSCVAYGAVCWWQNRQRKNTSPDAGLSEYEKTEMGDMSPDYRYML